MIISTRAKIGKGAACKGEHLIEDAAFTGQSCGVGGTNGVGFVHE